MKTKLSKADIAKRNEKILELSKGGAKQTEIAEKFGVSAQRIGQIVTNYKKPKTLKKKALNIIDQIKPNAKNNLIEAIINSNMNNESKLELLKNLI